MHLHSIVSLHGLSLALGAAAVGMFLFSGDDWPRDEQGKPLSPDEVERQLREQQGAQPSNPLSDCLTVMFLAMVSMLAVALSQTGS